MSRDAVNMGLWPGGVCSRGHDLTAPEAWLYRSSGNRECRVCAVERRGKGRRKVRNDRKLGAFNGGIGSWRT